MAIDILDQLMGALIGLARAAEGNEELISESTDLILIEGLSIWADRDEALASLCLDKLAEEKRKLVPNCFSCASPCGRTSDFDLELLSLESLAVHHEKISLFRTLAQTAKHMKQESITPETMDYFRRILITIGRDAWDEERFFSFVTEAKSFLCEQIR